MNHDASDLSQRLQVYRATSDSGLTPDEDHVAREEPLRILVGDGVLATVMRTPGHDLELSSGLLFAEGAIRGPKDVRSIAHCKDFPEPERSNVVAVQLEPGAPFDAEKLERSLLASSACGVCGRKSIADLLQTGDRIDSGLTLSRAVLLTLPEKLRDQQKGFAATGGLHAAGLFDPSGKLLVLREDVGRHNAVDKVVGAALRHDLVPLSQMVLAVSGRISFEIVQKAYRAGLPLIAAVSAPTSLAIQFAAEAGITLAAFVRDSRFNVYTHAARIG